MSESKCRKVALYARVSTVGNGQSPEMQLRELREYVERRGWTLAGEYVDAGVSGAKDSRPELNRLMEDAHKHRFGAVVVWKFDRFARSVSHLLRALETFKSQGIEFISFSEQMDTSTPTGRMIFTVLGAVAELERSLIAERVRAGVRNARAKGKRLGRPSLEVRASDVRAMHEGGKSFAEIGKKLGVSAASAWRAAQTSVNNSVGASSTKG
jgi:DNA invertase Pin-like site-specific DNA recombinase